MLRSKAGRPDPKEADLSRSWTNCKMRSRIPRLNAQEEQASQGEARRLMDRDLDRSRGISEGEAIRAKLPCRRSSGTMKHLRKRMHTAMIKSRAYQACKERHVMRHKSAARMQGAEQTKDRKKHEQWCRERQAALATRSVYKCTASADDDFRPERA